LRGSFIAEAISPMDMEIATSQEHAPRNDKIYLLLFFAFFASWRLSFLLRSKITP